VVIEEHPKPTYELPPCKPPLPLMGFIVRSNTTLPDPGDISSTVRDIPARDRKDTSDAEDMTPLTTTCASGSTPRKISFEDLKPGIGHQVQENSIVTFRTKMKDSVGATVDRFSYELASKHHHFSQDLQLMVRSLRAHSNSAHGSFRVRSVGMISIRLP
jgi:hypothetical protein